MATSFSPYGIPLRRVDDFRERYMRMRNPDTIGGSRVLRVEEPYVNGRPGAVLAERNWKGEPVSRGGTEGNNMVELAVDQLAQDQAPPVTDFSAQDTPSGTVYTRRPFEALTGRTNFTPYGTISSRLPETEEQRVAREWHEKVVVPQQAEQGVIEEPIVDQYSPAQIAQISADRQRDILTTPGTPENDAWVAQENERRKQSGLGPLDTAYEDFVADQEAAREEDIIGRDLYNAARRGERQTRIEQGRRTRNGEMVPTRSSAITPQMAPRLREDARALARQIISGASPDEISRGYQDLSRSAVAGAPVPPTPQERYQEQQSRESAARLRLGEKANERAQEQFDQEKSDRKEFQDSLLKWQSAATEADRNRVIRDSPALQKYFGVRIRPDEGMSRTDYGTYTTRLESLEKKGRTSELTPEESQEMDFLRGAISKYTQDEAKLRGITPAPSATPEAKPLTKEKAQEFLKQAGGDKQKARALAKEAGYSF